ncbi:MAG: tetratricopeptide repeat protein [candidate division KSB1 bacterium]|nr:tetratricopeptide repeat protein [candidate division KSB1 bacterium]MDZ7335188.1 tetratricopeptide repeat protein [candidate division KSB1 bacterium]MDZ7356525.1 tetratricopeptide repeat protein [candidate division KSB1 bacterium]MDZ7400730.1 tetratricopeptide repeat protein [candidate division KSB1 bacterium]
MHQYRLAIISIALCLVFHGNGQAQMLTAGRFGLGLNSGIQKIYCEEPSGFNFGIETYAKYNFSPRFFANLAFGYGILSGTAANNSGTFHTDLITLDFKGAFKLLTESNFTPYGYLGLGAFHFSYHGPNSSSLPGRYLGGYFDASFFIGGGLEIKINPNLAFDSYLDYRFTTGDDLNNHSGGATDGYLNLRAGITYYLSPFGISSSIGGISSNTNSALDEIAAEDSNSSADDELNSLLEGLDNYREMANANMNMEEYIRLKSRIDQLNDAIRQKELEIEELKVQLNIRKEKIAELEKNLKNRGGELSASLEADLSDFAASYEKALQHYYAREFDAAIYLFSSLLETNPKHRLSSNCQYWIGESYFGKGEYQSALDAFRKVLEFQESFKKDDALLMMGRCYMLLGDKKTALAMFDQLMNEFPDSEYFQKAQKYASSL